MTDDFIKNFYDKHIKSWFQKNYKFIITILIYILYQCNFILAIIQSLGLNISSLPRIPRIACFMVSDMIYVVIILLMFKKEIKAGIKDIKEHAIDRSLLAVNCWIAGCLIMTISSLLISRVLNQGISENEALVRQGIKIAPVYMLFTCAIVAPILEEMVFRRSLRGFIKFKWLFILVSGLGFGLLHVLGSYSNPLDFLYVVPYGAMGCAFAYLYSKSDNIVLPIAVHMLHNTILVLVQIFGG